jgi:excisionase family DNA binding protein
MRLLRVTEAAESLAVAASTVYTLIDRGDLPHVRFGRAIRVRQERIVRRICPTKQEAMRAPICLVCGPLRAPHPGWRMTTWVAIAQLGMRVGNAHRVPSSG